MTHDSPTPLDLPDLRGLAEFVAVARLGHVTAAASELDIPQPTLSRRLARLEASVGTSLMRRQGRGIVLTRAGRTLAASAQATLGELDRVVRGIGADVDEHGGLVTLAFLHTLGPDAVPRLLGGFARERPHIRFRLVQDGHDAVMRGVRAGDVDLALTAPLPSAPDVVSSALQRQRLCLTVPRGHRLAGRRRVPLPSLAEETFIGFKPGYGMRQIAEEWCRAAGFRAELAFEGEDIGTVRGLVAAGLGVALLPRADRPLPAGLVEVDVHDPSARRTIGMVHLVRPPLSPPAAAFVAFVRRHGVALLGPTASRRDP
ncbi:MAG: LysR family transcriptional regulator [Nocardioides sp.]